MERCYHDGGMGEPRAYILDARRQSYPRVSRRMRPDRRQIPGRPGSAGNPGRWIGPSAAPGRRTSMRHRRQRGHRPLFPSRFGRRPIHQARHQDRPAAEWQRCRVATAVGRKADRYRCHPAHGGCGRQSREAVRGAFRQRGRSSGGWHPRGRAGAGPTTSGPAVHVSGASARSPASERHPSARASSPMSERSSTRRAGRSGRISA